jgi:protein-S-isoprenylcysteine O-methyltransferase Ste14
MFRRLLTAVLILPGTAVVLVPTLIVFLTAGTPFGARLAGPRDFQLWLGLILLGAGLCGAIWTSRLFVTVGRGTPAPWDPPQTLVVRGPYRHVRNPMITSVLLILAGEALILRSWGVAIWLSVFFAANAVYFPLSEEKNLERRFGDDYRRYKANVPRWLPRLRPWEQA